MFGTGTESTRNHFHSLGWERKIQETIPKIKFLLKRTGTGKFKVLEKFLFNFSFLYILNGLQTKYETLSILNQ